MTDESRGRPSQIPEWELDRFRRTVMSDREHAFVNARTKRPCFLYEDCESTTRWAKGMQEQRQHMMFYDVRRQGNDFWQMNTGSLDSSSVTPHLRQDVLVRTLCADMFSMTVTRTTTDTATSFSTITALTRKLRHLLAPHYRASIEEHCPHMYVNLRSPGNDTRSDSIISLPNTFVWLYNMAWKRTHICPRAHHLSLC